MAEEFDPYAPFPAREATETTAPVSSQKPATQEEPASTEIPPEAKVLGAGAAGAAAGAAFGPKFEPPKELVSARATKAGAEAALEQARAQAAQAGTTVGSQADLLKIQLDVARSEVDAAREAYDLARRNAERIGALPEKLTVINVPGGAAPGTSASPEGLSQGALRHSGKMGEISEANIVRKGAAPLTGYTQSSRLIVPNELAGAPIYNSVQKSAQAELAAAEAALQNAIKNLGATQSQWQKLTGATPQPVSSAATRVAAKEVEAARAAARLQEMEKVYPGMEKFRSALRTGLNFGGGGLSAMELADAWEKAQQGKWTEAALSATGGLGGAMMLSKDPRTVAMGALISSPSLATQIPKLYQEYVQPRLFPEKSVMENQ